MTDNFNANKEIPGYDDMDPSQQIIALVAFITATASPKPKTITFESKKAAIPLRALTRQHAKVGMFMLAYRD